MSVESVGLALPAIFAVSGSPVTSTGTLEGDLVTQAPNSVFAGPVSGSADVPAFRALDAADLPPATSVSVGAVSAGSGLSVDGSGVLSVNAPAVATTGSLGVISVGTGLSVTGGGVLSANAPALATNSTPGIVSAGTGLSVDGAGVLSANAPSIATTSALGVISVGAGLSVTGGGVLSANTPALATASTPGIISAGGGLSVNGSGVLSANAPAVATTGSVGVVSVGSGLSITPAGVLSRSASYSAGVPALSSFTRVNQSSATITEVSGSSITISSPAASSFNNCILYKAAPSSTPYRLAAFLSIGAAAVNYLGGGIGFYDPSTGKFVEVFFCQNLSNVCNIQVSKWNSATSFNTTPVTWTWSMNTGGFWLGLRDDGTNVYYEYSADGANFVTIYSEVKASGFLSSYSNVAFIANPNTAGSTRNVNATLFVWDTNGLSRTPSIVG